LFLDLVFEGHGGMSAPDMRQHATIQVYET
jgi:hypothetical protein